MHQAAGREAAYVPVSADASRHIRGRALVAGAAVLLVGAGVGTTIAVFGGTAARGFVERTLTKRLGRPVHISGGVRLHLLSASPLADFYGLRIGQPGWAGAGDMVKVDHLRVRMPWSALTGGGLRFDELDLDRPVVSLLREKSGRANWTFDSGTRSGSPLKLPFIGTLSIHDGRLELRDEPRDTVFAGPVFTDAGGPDQGGLHLRATGATSGKPLSVSIDGASLSKLKADAPYVVAGDGRAGGAELRVKVALARPFDFGHFTGHAASSGRSLYDLYGIIGVPLPNTPQYALTTRFSRDGARYTFDGLHGRVGASDIHGALRLDMVGNRRRLTGALQSDRLHLTDLLAVIGGKAASTKEAGRPVPAQRGESRYFLPDAKLNVGRLRKLDGAIRFTAPSVYAEALPIRRLSFTGRLDRGWLRVRPLEVRFTRGSFEGGVAVDARGPVPMDELDGRFNGFRADDVLAFVHAPKALSGPLSAWIDVRGRGISMHQAAARAEGGASVVIGSGQVRRSFGEFLGGDVAGGYLRLLRRDESATDLRCAAVGLTVRDGRAALAPLTIDTGVAAIDGSGWVDLGAETMALRLTGRSKRPQLLRSPAPVTISGSWRKPRVSLDAGKTAKAAATGVLSSLLSPLKAVLPGLGPKPAPDLDCRALAARAEAVSAGAMRTGRARPD